MGELSLNSAGLNSLSGFSFQIKVFIYQMTKLQKNQCVEFETLDDVAVQTIAHNDKIEDQCLKLSITAESKTQLFQVKQTKVTQKVGTQVLYNWLVAYKKYPEISEYMLMVAQGYSVSENIFNKSGHEAYTELFKEKAKTQSLRYQVQQCYKGKEDDFVSAYESIKSRAKVKVLENIDVLIRRELEDQFRAEAPGIGEKFFTERIKELCNIVCTRIINSAAKRIPYICDYREYMQLCEEICRRISPEEYEPNYEAFRQVIAVHDLDDTIKESREYRQLEYCMLERSEIEEHIRWEQFYQNIRNRHLADAKKEMIVDTEGVAYRNYRDVVLELKADDKDSPLRRLINTKKRPISSLRNEYSRWGSYIYLTQEEVEQKISWKDEEKTNE